MKVYVYTESWYTPDEYVGIADVQVFKYKADALSYLAMKRDDFLNYPDDEWVCDWGDKDGSTFAHLSAGNDDVVMSVTERDI
jgi:hypothetical protein